MKTKPTIAQKAEAKILAHKIRYILNARWELERFIEYMENRPELILSELQTEDCEDIL